MVAEHADEPRFIRFLGRFFGACADLVVNHAWKLIISSTILTILCAVNIPPLSQLSNKISDFTPLDAPSYEEGKITQNFFGGDLKMNTINAFVIAKDGGNLYTVPKMKEAIRVMDTISLNFMLNTPNGEQCFDDLCNNFCMINEPVRMLLNGMELVEMLGKDAYGIDLGYPITTMAGMPVPMDGSLFGVKIAVDRNGSQTLVAPSDVTYELNTQKQLLNNLREIKLIVFHFKSELDANITQKAINEWEGAIANHFKNDFNSSLLDVSILTESFITSEAVRTGLSLAPFFGIGFAIMLVFSAASFTASALALKQMGCNKMWLALFACAAPFMSCGVGLGSIILSGMRFGSILTVTPFLVLAIGVDDAYLMVNAWQQITAERRREAIKDGATVENELLHRTREMLVETGPAIAITTITNIAAFAISAFSGSPEIQLFSISNVLCVFIDFIFQLTVYGSLMVILGRREIAQEFAARTSIPAVTEKPGPLDVTPRVEEVRVEGDNSKPNSSVTAGAHKVLRAYCEMLSTPAAVTAVFALLAAYLAIVITGTIRITPALRPEQLFLKDSPLTKLFAARQEFMTPHYSVAWIYVLNPGDIRETNRRALIDSMVTDFESLPQSVGKYSTKFWLRAYDEFEKANPENEADNNGTANSSHSSQMQAFLSTPQNSIWRGFMQFKNGDIDSASAITGFIFMTAFKGEELREWPNRASLQKKWREIAKNYSSLSVTVWQDDALFLDIIETMIPQATQSALLTFVSMFIVTCLFIPSPLVLFTATFSILSTSLGVFGLMSWIGNELDPMLMTATIMSIGFSVDIPAHIAYHYHQTEAHFTSVVDRLEHTIARVGFPIFQASLSTILCVSSLFFVGMHMATIFAATMLSVVVIGAIHGLLVMPAIFSAFAMLRRSCGARSSSVVSDPNPTPITSLTAVSSQAATPNPGIQLPMGEQHSSIEPRFIRFLGRFFGACADLVVNHAWKLIISSAILTILCAIHIPPLSQLSNRLYDYTPQSAPSYAEWRVQQNFYGGNLTMNNINAFVTAKDGGNLYTIPRMKEAIRVLDTISLDIKMNTPNGELAFADLCVNFCHANEPVRMILSGMGIVQTFGVESDEMDLGYPTTSLAMIRAPMDGFLFGVKVAMNINGTEMVVGPSDYVKELNTQKQLPNNLREFKMIVFTFKSELDANITQQMIDDWEAAIAEHFQGDFNSSLVDVTIVTDSFIFSESLRAGRSLLPYFGLGFATMLIFSAGSFTVSALALNQMGCNKMWLALLTSAAPIMSCGVGIGAIIAAGMRFGSILIVTPFLVLAIGVDDAYMMANAWQQITAERRRAGNIEGATVESELLHRTRKMLIAAFAISAFSGSPEIQLFSISNVICVAVTFVFQLTVYCSLMVILGRREIKEEFETRSVLPKATEKPGPLDIAPRVEAACVDEVINTECSTVTAATQKLIRAYCEMLLNPIAVTAIMAVLFAYLAISITGTMRIKPEMRPEQTFLTDSPLKKLFAARQEFLTPHYSVAWVFVLNPGDIRDPIRRELIDSMVHDFESLPQSVGRYSTKLWMHDYDDFKKAGQDPLTIQSDSSVTVNSSLQAFLSSQEHSFWRGFIQFEPEEGNPHNESEAQISRFIFTTAFKGEELMDWPNRASLQKKWREIAKNYAELNVTVWQDDAFFLDIIETMIPQSTQSAMLTFISMFFVTLLFIPSPLVLCTVTFIVVSTTLGVFGLMSWIGNDLDPMLMTATIMCIGFSVDIPAHIAYHYHQTEAHFTTVVDRLEHTIARVGFPVAQASLSTILCVSSLFFVGLHIATILAGTIVSVIVIGAIHALVVMPAIFSAFAMLQRVFRSRSDVVNAGNAPPVASSTTGCSVFTHSIIVQ